MTRPATLPAALAVDQDAMSLNEIVDALGYTRTKIPGGYELRRGDAIHRGGAWSVLTWLRARGEVAYLHTPATCPSSWCHAEGGALRCADCGADANENGVPT